MSSPKPTKLLDFEMDKVSGPVQVHHFDGMNLGYIERIRKWQLVTAVLIIGVVSLLNLILVVSLFGGEESVGCTCQGVVTNSEMQTSHSHQKDRFAAIDADIVGLKLQLSDHIANGSENEALQLNIAKNEMNANLDVFKSRVTSQMANLSDGLSSEAQVKRVNVTEFEELTLFVKDESEHTSQIQLKTSEMRDDLDNLAALLKLHVENGQVKNMDFETLKSFIRKDLVRNSQFEAFELQAKRDLVNKTDMEAMKIQLRSDLVNATEMGALESYIRSNLVNRAELQAMKANSANEYVNHSQVAEYLSRIKSNLVNRTEVEALRSELGNNLTISADLKYIPIGFIYTQLPAQPDPSRLWPAFVWSEVSETYAGAFFRVLGNNSGHFGEYQSEQSPRLTNVQSVDGWDYFDTMVRLRGGQWSGKVYTGTENHGKKTWSLQFLVSAGEVRPRNTAVKIWKRVQ